MFNQSNNTSGSENYGKQKSTARNITNDAAVINMAQRIHKKGLDSNEEDCEKLFLKYLLLVAQEKCQRRTT